MSTPSTPAYYDVVPMGPPDKIFGLKEKFDKDTFDGKVNLIIGAYRDDDGKPVVLESVKEAERQVVAANFNKEYLPITGLPAFVDVSLRFAYGDKSEAFSQGRLAAAQTLSGTGALKLASEFMHRFYPSLTFHVPNPTWANHVPIIKGAGAEVTSYRYYDPATLGLDLEGMLEDIAAAPAPSLFLLHACAHNPTGVDPSEEQWRLISAALNRAGHFVLVDCAYQGFATGDADRDAAALRMLVADGNRVMLAQSFAKNFGLYGERVGCFSVVCADAAEASRVTSQLKVLIRGAYSSPPLHGARLVATVLKDEALTAQWRGECAGMSRRIAEMRVQLRKHLLAHAQAAGDWSNVTSQIGMFCYTGLSPDQVVSLREEHHVYLASDGRISMAGINSGNVEYVAKSIGQVITTGEKEI